MVLFTYFILYFLLIFVIRSILLWRKTGINALTFNNTDDAHGFNGKVFTGITFIELLVVGVYAFKIEWYSYLLPFWYLENELLLKIGWSLLIVSLIIVWISQSQMANAWRIGIDENSQISLVTSGMFAVSRNPIFLGIMLANLGLFLVIPNAFTLLIVSLSTISINTQIRLEEAFLKQKFGTTYLEYFSKVNRWI